MASVDWASVGTGIALVIAALGVTIPQIGTFVMTWLARNEARLEAKAVKEKLEELHLQGNSNLDAVKKLQAVASFAEGKEAGINQERNAPMVPAEVSDEQPN